MKAFYIRYGIRTDKQARLYAGIREARIAVRDMTVSSDIIYLSVTPRHLRQLKRLLAELGAQHKVISKGFILRLAEISAKRCGIMIGAVFCTAAVMFAKSRTLNIEILSDKERIKNDITALLTENNAGIGSYIPDLPRVKLEREIKQKVSGVSWAGISITDSTLIIDVIEDIPQPVKHFERMPSDLVAAHDGVIEKAKVLNGQFVKTIGSGVTKGEVLVSGTVPEKRLIVSEDEQTGQRKLEKEETTRYVRSIGEIYGTYTEVQIFEQKYSETSLVHTGEDMTISSIRLPGAEIPLSLRNPAGMYLKRNKTKNITIAGKELPVSINKKTYEKCGFSAVIYTKEQAAEKAMEKKKRYEKNFLSESDIRKCEIMPEYKDDRAVLTVKYEIYGRLSEEKQFFIKK